MNSGFNPLVRKLHGSFFNAFKTLNAAGIRIADNAEGTVREAVQAFLDGKLTYADAPNTDGHLVKGGNMDNIFA
ncbi:MAG: hypothetical protein K9J83_05945 [Desulfarculaceae bacterium]|nr:hypothetical protein [Desulfarculaceae bacterium]